MYDEEISVEEKPIFPEVRIFWLVIAVFVAIAVIAAFLNGFQDRFTYIQTVVLTLTLIVVVWYTYLTHKVQEAMVQQTNVNILPIIEIDLFLEGGTAQTDDGLLIEVRQSYLRLRNIGNGTALNVTIDDMLIKDSMSSPLGYYLGDPLWFGTLSSLAPNEARKIHDEQFYDRQNTKIVGMGRPNILKYLSPGIARRDYQLVIRFSDMLGNKYAQIYTIGKSGTSIGAVQKNKNIEKRIVKFN